MEFKARKRFHNFYLALDIKSVNYSLQRFKIFYPHNGNL